jgi:protein-S-isoprenylcysteine O-methyltransferase Ste14
VSIWRHVRAIGLLPVVNAGLVPAAIVLLGDSVNPGWGLPAPLAALVTVAGAASAAFGLTLMYRTIRLFATRGEGTLAPWDPPRKLVVEGPYRHVRNPMITGVWFLLAGEALVLGSVRIALWLAVFAAANMVYMPLSEEPGLERRFGEDYRTYKREVPAWIPRATPWRGLSSR